MANWTLDYSDPYYMTGDNNLTFARRLRPNQLQHIAPSVAYVRGQHVLVAMAQPVITPIKPEYSKDFQIDWVIQLTQGTHVLRNLSGLITCEICLNFVGYAVDKEVDFDFTKTWTVSIASALNVLVGAATIRYLTPRQSSTPIRMARFLLTQAFDLAREAATEYRLGLQLTGRVFNRDRTDGKLSTGDSMIVDVSTKVEDEVGTIEVRDY